MVDQTIRCPKCKAAIPLTEAVAGPLIANAQAEFDKRLNEQKAITHQAVVDAVTRVRVEARDQAQEAAAADLATARQAAADAAERLKQYDAKLATAQAAQAEALTLKRQLEDERRELALTVEQQVSAGIAQARAVAQQEAEQSIGLRLSEKEETIASMGRVIEDLRRKAEQGSQQAQGEALELQLEAAVQERFPRDTVTPVPKGQFGGDIIHQVEGAGVILWELKRTKNWSDGWLPKLRADGRAAKADLLILVSNQLGPAGVNNPRGFECVDGVWVCHPTVCLALCAALRAGLLQAAAARRAAAGQESKAVAVYSYLTGVGFRRRVEAVVEFLTNAGRDLEAERKAVTRLWAKREEQLRRAADAMSGLYGDLQGIAGAEAGELEGLALPALEVEIQA